MMERLCPSGVGTHLLSSAAAVNTERAKEEHAAFPPALNCGTSVEGPAASSTPQLKLPSALVMGDSNVCHVTVPGAVTRCHPGALVSDISHMLPRVLDQTPSLQPVVLHVGANNIKQQQSELLKREFCHCLTH